ncbi:hypothetical protein F0L68_40150 [Solihabitans fulvus]|uniref:Uncharacterized protein n=1 Tax=Solihabitans fulvus TaxID=1892852 RepID=A0A5B2W915_9PSEU|nr:hypothetical protein [Solihabitans fulvus]KAA2247318.1 hypothetical protein F0L68_40150 [Solihabitans fulvus]
MTAARVSAAVAVVSDGSALSTGHDRLPLLPALGGCAALLRELAGLDAIALPVAAADARQLAASLRSLPVDIGAIALLRTDPARARAAQQALRAAGCVPVVTEQDTTTVALTAALLTALRRTDTPPRASRVVVAGAARVPGLTRLLMAAGVGDIVSWDTTDAVAFPLSRIARGATAVIDLVDRAAALAHSASWHDPVTVIAPDGESPLLALPGLLTAAVSAPAPLRDGGEDVEVELAMACVRVLMEATPPDRLLPELSTPGLSAAVARAALATVENRQRQ